MTKVLIIHPQDDTTIFLNDIYKKIPNKTIKGGITSLQLHALIESHDRVMMMVHGTGNRLLSVGQFSDEEWYIINYTTVPYIEKKMNNKRK